MPEPGKERYFIPMESSGKTVKKLKYFAGGKFHESKTDRYMDCYDPSTGEVIALAPQCTAEDIESAIQAAKEAFPEWAAAPPSKRVQVFYRLKALVDQHLEELTHLVAQENGKAWNEAMGDILKVNEVVPGYEKGFYIGPTILDHIKPGMAVGEREVFGPVLCIKRAKDFEEGITLMNSSEFANGSVIYTQNGYFAREFGARTHAGMVGVNVGIPVPLGIFGFTGHKNSFFGDLHVMGSDGVRFYTELKTITTTWFSEEEEDTEKECKVDTWD